MSHCLCRKPQKVLLQDRRQILLGLLVGIPAAMILPKFFKRKTPPILPPGAKNPEHFAATCTRCYACIGVCPTRIITVKVRGSLGEIFAPEIDLSAGHKVCEEGCNACSQVCPTGAIAALTLKQKQHRQISRAKVIRKDCIAWEDNQVCMVCDEYCPYNAIDALYRPEDKYKDVPLPKISSDRCRGCGYCKKHCVSLAPGKAIAILPIEEQTVAG